MNMVVSQKIFAKENGIYNGTFVIPQNLPADVRTQLYAVNPGETLEEVKKSKIIAFEIGFEGVLLVRVNDRLYEQSQVFVRTSFGDTRRSKFTLDYKLYNEDEFAEKIRMSFLLAPNKDVVAGVFDIYDDNCQNIFGYCKIRDMVTIA